MVRTDYDWTEFLKDGRVKAVLNYVATQDLVVAIFPKALQTLRLQDLGSAGHDGFAQASLEHNPYQITYVRGGHSAALAERNWRSIAKFIVDGSLEKSEKSTEEPILDTERTTLAVTLGRVAPFIWLVLFLILVWIGHWILFDSGWTEWKAVIFLVYLWGVAKVLTQF